MLFDAIVATVGAEKEAMVRTQLVGGGHLLSRFFQPYHEVVPPTAVRDSLAYAVASQACHELFARSLWMERASVGADHFATRPVPLPSADPLLFAARLMGAAARGDAVRVIGVFTTYAALDHTAAGAFPGIFTVLFPVGGAGGQCALVPLSLRAQTMPQRLAEFKVRKEKRLPFVTDPRSYFCHDLMPALRAAAPANGLSRAKMLYLLCNEAFLAGNLTADFVLALVRHMLLPAVHCLPRRTALTSSEERMAQMVTRELCYCFLVAALLEGTPDQVRGLWGSFLASTWTEFPPTVERAAALALLASPTSFDFLVHLSALVKEEGNGAMCFFLFDACREARTLCELTHLLVLHYVDAPTVSLPYLSTNTLLWVAQRAGITLYAATLDEAEEAEERDILPAQLVAVPPDQPTFDAAAFLATNFPGYACKPRASPGVGGEQEAPRTPDFDWSRDLDIMESDHVEGDWQHPIEISC